MPLETHETIIIRAAGHDDLPAITEIYNESVLTTNATMDTEPRGEADQKRWFEEHYGRYPVLVAELGGTVVGWASLSRWSERCGYQGTAEVSIYIRASSRGKGIGKKLLDSLIQEGKRLDFHSLVAQITVGNEISYRLHEAFGFTLQGELKEVGFKFGQWLDVSIWQKFL